MERENGGNEHGTEWERREEIGEKGKRNRENYEIGNWENRRIIRMGNEGK